MQQQRHDREQHQEAVQQITTNRSRCAILVMISPKSRIIAPERAASDKGRRQRQRDQRVAWTQLADRTTQPKGEQTGQGKLASAKPNDSVRRTTELRTQQNKAPASIAAMVASCVLLTSRLDSESTCARVSE
jgi:hypothetical protein